MGVTIIGLVVIVIFIAVFGTMLFKEKKKGTYDKNKTNDEKSVGLKRKDEAEMQKRNIFEFMEFESVTDNMIVQDKESRYSMVVQCKGINYDLMSEIEQLAVEEGFITFLNTLKFPVQLYVQATAIDLKKSMNIYKDSVTDLQDRYNTASDLYNSLNEQVDIDFEKVKNARIEKEKYSNILEYAEDITRYVERISLNKNVLQRKFYIVLSYSKSEITVTTEFNKKELFEICQKELYTRAQTLISALNACSVSGRILDSNEIAELLYISYNRDDEKLINVKEALESGFYRMYSTSNDVFQKKEALIQREVEREAVTRVQEAIADTMRMQNVKTTDQLVEEFEDMADREALNIITQSNISPQEKDQLTDVISEKHVVGVEQRKRKREVRDNLLIKQNIPDTNKIVQDEEIVIPNVVIVSEEGNVANQNPETISNNNPATQNVEIVSDQDKKTEDVEVNSKTDDEIKKDEVPNVIEENINNDRLFDDSNDDQSDEDELIL